MNIDRTAWLPGLIGQVVAGMEASAGKAATPQVTEHICAFIILYAASRHPEWFAAALRSDCEMLLHVNTDGGSLGRMSRLADRAINDHPIEVTQ